MRRKYSTSEDLEARTLSRPEDLGEADEELHERAHLQPLQRLLLPLRKGRGEERRRSLEDAEGEGRDNAIGRDFTSGGSQNDLWLGLLGLG